MNDRDDREHLRQPSGRFGDALARVCVCGHPKGAHVFPSGRQCMVADLVEGEAYREGPTLDEPCACTGFVAIRRRKSYQG